jgi:hypothetical protein
MNPPRPPDPTTTKITKAIRSAFHGQEFALGIFAGVILTLVIRLVSP